MKKLMFVIALIALTIATARLERAFAESLSAGVLSGEIASSFVLVTQYDCRGCSIPNGRCPKACLTPAERHKRALAQQDRRASCGEKCFPCHEKPRLRGCLGSFSKCLRTCSGE